ncbi:MAG: TonB-dependent hemoglobin/transferrin/lactoferrin family receptor, partial [Gammaproteobacteria bacterium]|nr:TonB-dependent hemoglobin/transferrin/lactoferrin family receptor [Gammaproteobacteria bacterium]
LLETPAAVNTISSEQIETIQPYGYADIFDDIPGVAVQGGPRRIAEEPAIRGFQDEQVIIRIDGTRQNFNQAHRGRFLLDPDLLKSVEVLRGSGSAIYGSGALGGVFALETKDGRDYTGGQDGFGDRIKLGYQSNGEELGIYNTLYGQSNMFDFLFSAVYRDLSEDLEDGDGDDIAATKDQLKNGFLKFGISPSAEQRVEFTVEDYENEGINPASADDLASPTNIVDRTTERRGARVSYEYTSATNDWLDLRVTAYKNDIETSEFRLDDSRIDENDFETSGFEAYNSSRFDLGDNTAVITYGIEQYTDEQFGTRNGAPRIQFPDAEADYSAAYIQAELPFNDFFTLIPGIRYDEYEYDAGSAFPRRDEDQVSPKLSAGFNLSDNFFLWAGYSEAFRAPSLTELFVDGVHFVVPLAPGQIVINEFVSTPDLEPEEAETMEIGLRYGLRNLAAGGDELLLNATYYESDVDNFVDSNVVFISGPPTFDPFTGTLIFPGTTTNVNVDAEFKGYEIELSYDSPRFFGGLAYSAVDSEDKASGDGLGSTQPDKLNLNFGAKLKNGWRVGGRMTFAAEQDDVPDGSITTDSYDVLDLYATWTPTNISALRGVNLNFGIDNVTDETFRIHPSGVNQPGRNLKFTIAKSFGIQK